MSKYVFTYIGYHVITLICEQVITYCGYYVITFVVRIIIDINF